MSDAVTTAVTGTPDPAPVFDPDPDLVADLENFPFALRTLRKAAQKAHAEAVKARQADEDANTPNP